MDIDFELLTKVAVRTIVRVQRNIAKNVARDPITSFTPMYVGRENKPLLRVDVTAEAGAEDLLFDGLSDRYDLRVVGEEKLKNQDLDLTNDPRLVALLDMVDGTDLLERGLSNWCSAIVFFCPAEHKIVAAFVGIYDQAVYAATEKSDHPWKYSFHRSPSVATVAGPSAVTRLEDASVAFYGQKLENFLSVASNEKMMREFRELDSRCRAEKREPKIRLYNLAGNPMMMKLIDGHGPTRIDAVFDVVGQYPHDVVPGAYIAQKARGVAFTDLSGAAIDLAPSLLRPASSKLRYVLASTQQLAGELRSYLAAA